jgi:hypothetical protein
MMDRRSLLVALGALVGLRAREAQIRKSDCSIQTQDKRIRLYGKVQVVEHFPDLKVQVVEHFPDLKVQLVDHFPDACGKWQYVEHFPDFKIQFVEHFPDLKIQFVDHFPGLP